MPKIWKDIFGVSKFVVNKKNERNACDMKECKKARTVKFSTKWQVGRLWLKYDEEKVMFWEWCIKNKQTLVAQNVLNLTRFLYGCTSHKTGLISYLEKSAAHLLAKK